MLQPACALAESGRACVCADAHERAGLCAHAVMCTTTMDVHAAFFFFQLGVYDQRGFHHRQSLYKQLAGNTRTVLLVSATIRFGF